MRNKFNAILRFFQLLDKTNNLSLTNIVLIVVLVKIAISPLDLANIVLLLPAIASYMHKRHETNKAEKNTEVADLKTTVSTLQQEFETVRASYATIAKQAEDTKRTLTASALNSSVIPPFVPRNKRPTQE